MQYALAYKTIDAIRELVELLKKEGYRILHGLENIKDDKDIIGVCVDLDKKIFFHANTTCMAWWCTYYQAKPLYVEELIEYFDKLIIKKDFDFYKKLLKKTKNDPSRPEGVIISIRKLTGDKK